MFKRRTPLSLSETIKEFFWPSMGLKRTFHYLKHRILRVGDSTHKVALGLAIGLGVSFTPLLGTHFIQAGIVAYLLRGNVFTAMLGTFIGNPSTFPFFWWAGFSFGAFLFSVLGIEGTGDLPDHMSLHMFWDMAWSEPLTLFLPWMLGGYILFAVSVPTSYFVYYYLIELAKKAKAKALHEKREKKKAGLKMEASE